MVAVLVQIWFPLEAAAATVAVAEGVVEVRVEVAVGDGETGAVGVVEVAEMVVVESVAAAGVVAAVELAGFVAPLRLAYRTCVAAYLVSYASTCAASYYPANIKSKNVSRINISVECSRIELTASKLHCEAVAYPGLIGNGKTDGIFLRCGCFLFCSPSSWIRL